MSVYMSVRVVWCVVWCATYVVVLHMIDGPLAVNRRNNAVVLRKSCKWKDEGGGLDGVMNKSMSECSTA